MRNMAAKEVQEYCQKHDNGFLIAGDAGFGVWDNFQKELPTQYINPGINEQATIGLAAGMALSGHKVFYYNIIPFVLMRCYEQVRVDICYQNLPIILIGIGSGITYAPAGMTHYSVEDISIAKTMPNLNIISPSDPIQVQKAIAFAIKSETPTYIRVSRSGEPTIFDENLDITKPIYLRKGNARAIIFHGSIIDEVLEVSKQIANVDIISIAMLHPFNAVEIQKLLAKYIKVYIVEEHFEEGGLGSILSDFIVKNKIDTALEKIAIKNHYIHEIGDYNYLRKKFEIDANSIIKRVTKDG